MKKKLYFTYLGLYLLILFIEFVMYLRFNSTLFGLLYMIINLIIIFLLSISLYNYSELNLKIRLSKNAILIVLILFSILLSLFKYADQSKLFISNIKVCVYCLKPLMILMLSTLSFYDYKIKGNILD
jgi:hypothetical protein